MDLGLFMMPLHPPHRSFGDVLREDADKIILADQLGFAEAWVGEHYTASTEPITSPLIFMANLISRTKTIKFATGVINMPNHHPAIVAGEVAMFDHMSGGRLIFGIGTGALASDFELFGSGDGKEREAKMLESIDIIQKIWASDPPYDIPGKFWTVRVRDNIVPALGVGTMSRPLQKPHPPIALSVMSPFSSTMTTAAKLGWIPISANFIPEYSIASHWQKYREGCEIAKRPPIGQDWRVARNIVVARSDAEARAIAFDPNGSLNYYFSYLWQALSIGKYTIAIRPDPKMSDADVTVDMLIDNIVIHGSPKTVAEKLIAFRERVGPFGKLVLACPDWEGANKAAQSESMRLLATEVMPIVRAATASRAAA
jgi:alkanesulfonate monooxygenase SsuD/methylene tetrahydromethanopterin reductase-like flavin-dependent oxidoreductase (luciferase family)